MVNKSDRLTAAFLQSAKSESELYLKPSMKAGCDGKTLLKLKKWVYGLYDVARRWHITMKTFLLKMKCIQVKTDPAAFY